MSERYRWADVDGQGGIEACTLAVVLHREPDEVVHAYGGDPSMLAGNYTFAETRELQEYQHDARLNFHLQLRTVDTTVIAMENNGYTGAIPETARRCSKDDRTFFSIFWNANGTLEVTAAENGSITASFDPLLAGEEPWPGRVHPPWLDLGEFQTDHIKAACLALVEWRTGVAFEREWLEDRMPTYRIPDPDVLFRDVPNAREP